MPVELDYCEYSTDADAQAAYVNSDDYGSDICTGGTASANQENEPASGAFDDVWDTVNPNDRWRGEWAGNNPIWLKYDLGAGNEKIVSKYRFQSAIDVATHHPTAWTFEGSNNDIDWDVLDTQSGISWSPNDEIKSFTFSNSTAYRYYRIYVTHSTPDDTAQKVVITEMEMMEINLQCYSESTIKQQGSYSLKGFAKATDSLNDTLTRTVSPTIDLTGQPFIRFYIRASRTGSNIKIGFRDSGGVTSEVTPNITSANAWQVVELSGIATTNKDAIDRIIVTIVNADSDNTFYIDNMFADSAVALTESLGLLESLPSLTRALEPLEENLALLESLPSLDRGLVLEESLALKEDETVAISALLTESLGLLESLPTLDRALTLEESLGLLEDVTDMLLDDASFEARLSKQLVKATIWLKYKGVDYTSYLNDVSTITRSADLTSGAGTATLSNISQIWNLFLADRTEIGNISQIGIKLAAEHGVSNEKALFTGKVEDVSYAEAEAILKVRDKMVSTLKKKLGNGENPVEYLTPQNPADLAWDLLTTHGGLDDTASTDNTDIDYTSWNSYKTDCDTLKYSLQARFTGHYITNALLMIANLTNSYIWIGGEGKFKFKRPIPPFTPGILPRYNRSNCLEIDASITKENLINHFRCRYGYNPDIDEWAGSYLAEDEASKTDFGTFSDVEEDKTVWHADLDSATEYADRTVDKNKQPLTLLTITSTLCGIFLSLGDTILVEEALKDWGAVYARIIDIQNIDIAQGLVCFVCRDISDEQIAAFVLDDPYWGILDQDYNPIL